MSTLFSSLTTYLPQHPGFLPPWLLFVGAISIANGIQAYATMAYTARVYCGPSPRFPPNSKVPTNTHATPLSARTFGTWTIIQGLVRVYAAYNIDNPAFYQLAFATYAVAWGHFVSEWFVFKSTSFGAPLAGPIFIANGTLLWMWLQWGFYLGY